MDKKILRIATLRKPVSNPDSTNLVATTAGGDNVLLPAALIAGLENEPEVGDFMVVIEEQLTKRTVIVDGVIQTDENGRPQLEDIPETELDRAKRLRATVVGDLKTCKIAQAEDEIVEKAAKAANFVDTAVADLLKELESQLDAEPEQQLAAGAKTK